ncbi:MAG: response regulator [Gammaproteobacteria bacterium]|nr:response regulator [Gammaproteobacteria bacterium]
MSKIYEIVVVDDTLANLQLLNEFLTANGYKVRSAINGETAIKSIVARHPDLILLDIKMPNMDGYDVCKQLKQNSATKHIPIIFISAMDATEDKVKAFTSGGVDFITKPFSNEEVLARVSTHLQLDSYKHSLEDAIEEGLKEIKLLNHEVELTQSEIVMTMAALTEERSNETGLHVVRVAEYSNLLANLHGMDENICTLIKKAAPMHDVGKVGIPDSILQKAGPLTGEEWETMKTHTTKGYEVFQSSSRALLKMAAIIAHEHHEYWDGGGYPRGLKENDINIAARIVTITDVFDALTHDRCYKKAWSINKTIGFLEEKRGQMFDPRLTDLFIANIDKFSSISDSLKD